MNLFETKLKFDTKLLEFLLQLKDQILMLPSTSKVKTNSILDRWPEYNIFMFPNNYLHTLFIQLVHSIYDYRLKINYSLEPLFLHAWLNIIYKNTKVPYHKHRENVISGYIYLSPEPSYTYFYEEDKKVTIENVQGKTVMFDVACHHESSIWNFDTPRISIGFDVIPTNVFYDREWPYKSTKGIPI